MTVEVVHRPTRASRPLPPTPPEVLAPPPLADGRSARGVPLQVLLPVTGALGSGLMIVVFRSGNRVFLVLGALLFLAALAGALALALGQRGGTARERRARREDYLDYLEKLRGRTRARGRELRAHALLLDPAPEALLDLARDPARLWERRRGDPDFLAVRVGLGDVRRLPLVVPPEQDPVHPYDPILLGEATAAAEQSGLVRGVPAAVRLDGAGQVALVGSRAEVLGLARSLLLQLAAWHAPEDLALAAAFPPRAAEEWRGVDLLPHLTDPDRYDGPVPVRRVAPSAADLGRVLAEDLAGRDRAVPGGPGPADPARLVVFVDDFGHPAATLPAGPGVTVVHLLADRLHEPSDVTVRVTVSGGVATCTDARREAGGGPPVRASADLTPRPLFEAVARTLAGRRLSRTDPDAGDPAGTVGVPDLLGLGDLDRLGPDTAWRPRAAPDFLRVPVGVDDLGAPVHLDLKEAAQLGMGPHGLCVGATGSGKSELLRTLILALAATHPPEDLGLVLVDYKGGAAFAPFAPLPHVAGIIDNLADDSQLTERARASIAGEVVRRQELLKAAGSSPSISHYRELRRTRPELPPLPHLLVVIDEFGELLTAQPEFVDLLLTIGRIGRSIGVHLLLSSQRIEAGKLRGLETYLSYRIGLRTFSESESATILDTKDAFHLPPAPGFGYLKVDTTVYRRFRSGHVSGPLEAGPARSDPPPVPVLLVPPYAEPAAARAGDRPEAAVPAVGRTLLAGCVDRLRAPDRQVAPVWLPPLPDRVALPGGQRDPGRLGIPLGLVDDPAGQRQDGWTVDLARGGGHLAVIGAPQSGRSTLLRSLAVSAALTHTPEQVSIYGMDLAGGGLRAVAGFPHVGGIATRGQPDRLRRVLEELLGMLATREQVFAERGIDSVAMLRAEHAAGRVPELVAPDVVLLVDGFGHLRTDFESLEDPLLHLLRSGSSFGIHVVLALTRWNDLRMAQQPLIGTRIELRLNDPVDSVVDRKLAALIRPGQPGRVLTEDRRFAQVALPALRLVDPPDLGAELSSLADRSRAGWAGPVAPPVRLLPTRLRVRDVPAPDPADPATVVLGLRQDTMGAAVLELGGRDQHLLALGDQGAGKTTLLTTVVRGLVGRLGPAEVVFAVLDVRGDLARAVPPEYLGAHATDAVLGRGLAGSVASELRDRAQDRSAGAVARRIVVVVDDHDMIGSGDRDLLRPLLPYLPSARDLGLHLLVTRPVAGAARALYDPVLQSVRETGGSVLLMSGEAAEGQVLPRTYAEPLPPGRGRFLRRGEPVHLVQVAETAG